MNEIEYANLIQNRELKSMKNIDVARTSEIAYLGPADAEKEWADPNIAKLLFVHTQAYKDFITPDMLILLGRTGTGKTAILKCVENEVKEKRLNQYQFVVSMSFDDIIDELSQFNDIDNSAKSRIEVQKSILYILNITIMRQMIRKYKKFDELVAVKEYLNNHNLLGRNRAGSTIKKVMQTLSSIPGRVGETACIIEKISDIGDILFTTDYEDAIEELHSYLARKGLLLLIDSSNEYNMCDNRTVVTLKALINDCFEFNINRAIWNVDVKLALPSEVYTHILQHLPGKQRGNTVVIQWKYDDLTSLIAKRFLYYIKWSEYSSIFQFLEKYDFPILSNVQNCRALLLEFLPPTCKTSLKFDFDTLAFCIRHTLKKPRELKTIFNALIDKIVETNNNRVFYENPEIIKDVIHSTQESMIGAALSMYNNSYPDIENACTIVLKNQKYIFKGEELFDRIKEASATTSKYGYGADEIKRVLLESGLIGAVSATETIPVGSQLNNDEEIVLVMARFEYQVKGFLLFDKDEYYVIHPMCFEHFTCYVNDYVLVYVDKNSDSQDVINTYITRNES